VNTQAVKGLACFALRGSTTTATIESITEPLKIFEALGVVREAARGFPANLQRSGGTLACRHRGGTERNRDLGDPSLTLNTHRIEVDSDSCPLSMLIENIPSRSRDGFESRRYP